MFDSISAEPIHTPVYTPPFRITVRGEEGRVRIVLSGELDLHTAPELELAVADAYRGERSELELDLRDVRFIDSTGIRALLVSADEAEARGVSLQIVPSTSPHVTSVFELTCMLEALPWSDRSLD